MRMGSPLSLVPLKHLEWLFQHNNDPKHTSKQSLGSKPSKLMLEWPDQSPNLNPIKNAVSVAKPKNVNELWNVVKESWSGITAKRCHTLVDSMPHICEAVIKNCGHTTKY
uniref:DDE-1 domain-containing protein n=1 Tax=Anabas testudineus TaxID=64144 RepID=A0A3Q1IXC1_ANATE